MAHDDVFASPDALLRHAAAADAADAVAMLARIEATHLLGYIVNQADMAVHTERTRSAGIDALGDLARAAIEVMGLPQDVLIDELDDADGDESDGPAWVVGDRGAGHDHDHDEEAPFGFEAADDVDEDGPGRPWVTGWELVTVVPGELDAATLALPVRPWVLGLVAFEDEQQADGTAIRRVVGAAADGRVAAARLHVPAVLAESMDDVDDTEVICATISRVPSALGPDAGLAAALVAALRSAARGT